MSDGINVTFVIPNDCGSEHDCSEEMQLAFTSCEQHRGEGLRALWVHERQFNEYEHLTKRDVIVLNEFQGELYEKLKAAKCLVVGPRCLSCCLTEGSSIPSGPEPVFTIAMRGLIVSASGLTKQQKDNIKSKVFWMGGIYSNVLSDNATHLVSDNVLSDKYNKAVLKGIPIMSESWIEAVWEASLRLNINGSSDEFNVHRLPAFTNLNVTTSGISRKDKKLIMTLVTENGGNYSGAFQSETTDVVVLNKEGVGSDKYRAALEYNKPCVLTAWVTDSVARGVALPMARYKVAGASTSSPLAEHKLPDMSLNFSRITNLRPPSNFIDETRTPDVTALSGRMKLSNEARKSEMAMDKDVVAAFESFDLSTVKKAGPIFDGFCIWVTGLEGISRERAAAIVSRGGGVRYDCPHDRVTHIVAGTKQSAVLGSQALPAVPVIKPMWLIRSVSAGRALDEAEYLMDLRASTPVKSSSRTPRVDPASPMSKRNLQLLRPADLPPPQPVEVANEPQHEIVNHYLSQPMPEQETVHNVGPPDSTNKEQPDITDDLQDELTEEIEQIFRGIKIEVGSDEEDVSELVAEISAVGGSLVAQGSGGTHVLVPLDFDTEKLTNSTAEPITIFWVKDCLSQQEVLPIQYYHRPVKLSSVSEPGVLHGVVASLSTYSGVERLFLDELAKLLGATTQLRFCRRNTPNALASTHLICPTPTGDKYMGALKWGLPAVTAEWLLECVKQGRRVSEKEFLVGDTKAPPSPEKTKPTENKTSDSTGQLKESLQTPNKENTMLPPSAASVPRRVSFPNKEGTPKGTLGNDGDAELSPASRYIAMARQGLLGGDTQETPKRLRDLKDDARQEGGEMRTPPLEDALSTPNLQGLSPTTRRRIQAVRRGEMPSDPIRTPTDPFVKNIPTPDSAFGAALRPGSGRLSPEARKRLWEVVNELPTKEPQPVKDKQTPLSEIRNRYLAQFSSDAPTPPASHCNAPRKLNLHDQIDTPPAKMAKLSEEQSAGGLSTPSNVNDSTKSASSSSSALHPDVDAQLQRLSAALSGLTSQRARRATRDSVSRTTNELKVPESEPGPESQPNTVGWDDTTPQQASDQPTVHVKRFLLSSNVDNTKEIIETIQRLNGEVCEGTETDGEATHLLCAAPCRSEKMLGSVAAGRWVLHPAYIVRSGAAGSYLDEEEFEWGNPKATCLPALTGTDRTLARAAYRWRSARAEGKPGPFKGAFVALLHVPVARRRLLTRLIAAGGGVAVEDEPPYNNEAVTVCFADIKRYPLSDRDTAWLISRKIPVCAPVLLSAYLTDDPPPKPEEHCLPEFRPR